MKRLNAKVQENMTSVTPQTAVTSTKEYIATTADNRQQGKVDINWLTSARDGFQTLFFIVVSTVTVLTYLKAKKTLLQPIRTEIFKEQIKVFAEILGHFSGKGEMALRQDWGVPELEHANTMVMFDDYAKLFFDIEIDRDKRPYNAKDCPLAMVTQEAMEKHFTLADGHLREEEQVQPTKPDPRTRAAIWAGHSHGIISIPKKMVEKEEELKRVSDSPLVPVELGRLLNGFLDAMHKNATIVGKLLTECAKDMPEKYPTVEDLNKSAFGWVQTRINRELVPLEEEAKKINDYIRKYFTSDSLLDVD